MIYGDKRGSDSEIMNVREEHKPQVIAIGNNKGGAGKTSTALELSYELHKRGYKTLLVDLDGQRNATIALDQKGASPTIFEVITGQAEGRESIIETNAGDLLPAGSKLDTLAQELTGNGKEYALKNILDPLRKKYDFIILDLPPAINAASTNALAAADLLLIASKAEAWHMEGIGAIYENADLVKTLCNPELKIQGIVITQYEKTTLQKAMYSNAGKIAEQIGAKIYAPIRKCSKAAEAHALHKCCGEYAPKCNTTIDYIALVDDFLKDLSV